MGKAGKQSSLRTIFVIWNTMLGSSMLSLPWAFSQAGIVGGSIVIITVGVICFYTATLVVKHGKGYDDFYELCYDCLGKPGQLLCWATSLLILLGALLAYTRLMADALFMGVNGVRSAITGESYGESTWWSPNLICPLAIFLIMFPITNMKSFDLIARLNSYGLLSVAYMIGFIFVQCVFVEKIDTAHPPPDFEPNFPRFGGILLLSFFIHNCVLPIMKEQERPENNLRDLGIGYVLVGLTYSLVGAVGYLAYHSTDLNPSTGEMYDDFLNTFSDRLTPAIIARAALLGQLITVFPLICYITRIQMFGLLCQSPYPGARPVFALNLVLCGTATLVAIVYPHVGHILRFTGSGCGLVYIFILPITCHVMRTYFPDKCVVPPRPGASINAPDRGLSITEDPVALSAAAAAGDYTLLTESDTFPIPSPGGEAGFKGPPSRLSLVLSLLFHGALVAFGAATLVAQFI